MLKPKYCNEVEDIYTLSIYFLELFETSWQQDCEFSNKSKLDHTCLFHRLLEYLLNDKCDLAWIYYWTHNLVAKMFQRVRESKCSRYKCLRLQCNTCVWAFTSTSIYRQTLKLVKVVPYKHAGFLEIQLVALIAKWPSCATCHLEPITNHCYRLRV